MGVFLLRDQQNPYEVGFPHARGGVSDKAFGVIDLMRFSPRPWGCFYQQNNKCSSANVFPTPVGVFLAAFANMGNMGRFPHARGGVSDADALKVPEYAFSPRPWGCFCCVDFSIVGVIVFPTPVGVFPDWQFAGAAGGSFPHARGGVSAITTRGLREVSFSPRPWGCFYIKTMDAGLSYVFPTPVGVFPRSFMVYFG